MSAPVRDAVARVSETVTKSVTPAKKLARKDSAAVLGGLLNRIRAFSWYTQISLTPFHPADILLAYARHRVGRCVPYFCTALGRS